MGDPAEPGEDQLTTIVIEGPPVGASDAVVKAYNAKFDKFKTDAAQFFKGTGLKIRIKKIENVKKS